MDIEAQFSADVSVKSESETENRLNVRLQTRIECKLSRECIQDNMIHIRQTGHVTLDANWSPEHSENSGNSGNSNNEEALGLIKFAIINVLKSVDCDLPPLSELCEVRI